MCSSLLEIISFFWGFFFVLNILTKLFLWAGDYTIILSGDCFILFEHINELNAKIVFWCSLYAISDIQIIQSLKSATINFYDNKFNKDFVLKLYIENTVLFIDILSIYTILLLK